jgi:pSer/pThr/pTyr-binding forkhead associated (FHA) protein/anti-anti-sigma regulatory factor
VDRQRYLRIKTILMDALEVPAADRDAFVSNACGSDLDLRREVESLLAQAVEDEFLEPLNPVEAERDPLVGQSIAGYYVLDLLGDGGMGIVYLAEDKRLGRRVALKFLRPELTFDAGAKERFIREARAGAALDHPNVCPLYGIEETADGGLFLVMRYYEGETLKQRLARGPLSIDEVLDIAVQIAEGLAAAHRAGIVHRDIKPGNVLLTEGPLKILDFGIAKIRDHAPLTILGSAIGTTAYMSPEQARGEVVDHRSDVWALGVVLSEMVLAGGVVDRSARDALLRVVDRATANAVGDRFQSMTEFAETLHGISSRGRFAERARDRENQISVVVSRDGRVAWRGHFAQPALTIGRDPEADVVLDDPRVSWVHATVRREPNGDLLFTDSSSNGSFQDGHRVERALVADGTAIVIKPFSLEFVPTSPTGAHPSTTHAGGDTSSEAEADLQLRIVKGPPALVGRVYPLAPRQNTIGRADDSDIRLDFPNISRLHATISLTSAGEWRLDDQESTNGVNVGGAPVKTVTLKAGDHIGFGKEIVAAIETFPRVLAGRPGSAFRLLLSPASTDPRVSVVRVSGQLPDTAALALQEQLNAAIGPAVKFLVVDFAQCATCGPSAFGVLVGLDVTLRRRAGAIQQAGLSNYSIAQYRALALERVLAAQRDEEAAVAALQSLVNRSQPR